MISYLRSALERIGSHLPEKGWRYWTGAAVILAITVAVTPYVDTLLNLSQYRDFLFQKLSQLGPRQAAPRFVKVVLVFDDQYWRGEPAGIRPINRHYLARLVDALDKADASLIALDFNLHIPDKNADARPGNYAVINPHFRAETEVLMKTLARVAQARKIVLPKTVEPEPPDLSRYRLLPDIYQPYGICTKPLPDGSWSSPGTATFPLTTTAKQNIRCGYIQLPWDMKQVPPVLDVDGGMQVDSFSLAIARWQNAKTAARVGRNTLIATYIPLSSFYSSKSMRYRPTTVVSATDLLAGRKAAVDLVSHRPVIVGGAWHISYDMETQGDSSTAELVDMHSSPIGQINGALIHENFTEAILDGRLNRPLPEWFLHVLEILFGIGAAIFFAAYQSIWLKLAGLVGLAALLLLLQWMMLLMFGVFFEALLPLLGLAVHSTIERLAEPRGALEQEGK